MRRRGARSAHRAQGQQTVAPGGAGPSRSTTPSSAATSVARAVTGFETDASRTARVVSPRVATTRRRGHAGGGERDVPGVDLVQRSHGARYYVPPWSGSSSPATRRTASRGSPARSSSVTGCTSPGRRRSRPTAPVPEGAYEQAALCLRIIAEALEQAGSGLEHVVRTNIYVTERRSRGRPGARRGFHTRPAATCVGAALLDPAWKVEIEAEAVLAREAGHPGGHHRPRRRACGERRRPQVRLE